MTTKTQHLVRMGYHVTPELRSLLQATGTELSETMKAAAARTRACELLAKLEVGLPLERHLTLLADSPMRGGTDQQVAMTGAEAGAETEMNQRVSNFRTRHAVTSPEGVPCRRGFVYEILQLIGMQNYIRILEQGLVGPFEEYHLASVQAFQKRHEELLLSPYQDTRKRHENDLLFALSYRHKPFKDRRPDFEKDRISELDLRKLHDMLSFLHANTPHGPGRTIFFWQDQMAKGNKSDNDLEWINTGLIPYMVLPVIKIVSERGETEDDNRLWLSCERMIAAVGAGLLIKSRVGGDHKDNVIQFPPALSDVLRRFAITVISGYLEGKDTYKHHRGDYLRLNKWAIDILLCDTWDECVRHLTREDVTTDISTTRELEPNDLRKIFLNYGLFHDFSLSERVLRVKARTGPWSDWSDYFAVIEADGGRDGGISAPLCKGEIINGGYELFSDEDFRYYVRIPRTGLNATEVVTGKLTKEESRVEGIILVVIKVNVVDLFESMNEMSLDVATLILEGAEERAAEIYVTRTKAFFEQASTSIVRKVWGNGDGHAITYEGCMSTELLQWTWA